MSLRSLAVRCLATLALVLAVASCSEPTRADLSGADAVVAVEAPFDFVPADPEVAAGEVSLGLENAEGGQTHSLVIEGRERDLRLSAGDGGSDVGTIDLEPGAYTFYCDIPGHQAAGMTGTLTVR